MAARCCASPPARCCADALERSFACPSANLRAPSRRGLHPRSVRRRPAAVSPRGERIRSRRGCWHCCADRAAPPDVNRPVVLVVQDVDADLLPEIDCLSSEEPFKRASLTTLAPEHIFRRSVAVLPPTVDLPGRNDQSGRGASESGTTTAIPRARRCSAVALSICWHSRRIQTNQSTLRGRRISTGRF